MVLVWMVTSQTSHAANLLRQKTGAWQNQVDKQSPFTKYVPIEFDFDDVPLRKVKRIRLHDNKIFILDTDRAVIYVLEKSGKRLYTIGRPGQGPGDLEFAYDYFIDANHKIYVLNSVTNRVEIFSMKGESIGSVRFEPPTLRYYPHSILVDGQNNIVIGACIENLVDLYSPKGDYKKSLLKSHIKADPRQSIVGVPTDLAYTMNKEIIHFDRFRGIFSKLKPNGEVEAVFSHMDEPIAEQIDSTEKNIKEKNKTMPGKGGLMSLDFWSNCCIDQLNNIYVTTYGSKKGEGQPLIAFSPKGEFLYSIPLNYFKEMNIEFIDCDESCFIFLTNNFELIMALRRK